MSELETTQAIDDYFRREAEKLTAKLTLLKPAIVAAAREIALDAVVATYDGEGDEGNIQEVYGVRNPGNNETIVVLDCPVPNVEGQDYGTLQDLIEDYAWSALAQHHAGFEINDGGFGTLTIRIADGTVTLERNDRFVDHETTTVEV